MRDSPEDKIYGTLNIIETDPSFKDEEKNDKVPEST